MTFVVLWTNRKNLDDERVQIRYGSLYMQYEKDWWYFELLDTLRRMLLTGGLVLVAAGSVGQIIAALLVSLFFLLLTARVSPFRSELDDLLAFICNLQQLLLFVVALGLKTQEEGGGGSEGTFSNAIFVFVVNGLTIMVVVIGVLTILSIFCKQTIEKWMKRCCFSSGRHDDGDSNKVPRKNNLQKVMPKNDVEKDAKLNAHDDGDSNNVPRKNNLQKVMPKIDVEKDAKLNIKT